MSKLQQAGFAIRGLLGQDFLSQSMCLSTMRTACSVLTTRGRCGRACKGAVERQAGSIFRRISSALFCVICSLQLFPAPHA